jgi:enolase
LDFQEYLVVPKKDDVKKSLKTGKEIYAELKGYLSERVGVQATNVGDEGGFSPSLSGNFEPLSILKRVIKRMDIKDEVKFSLDIAANDLAAKKSETEYNLSENTFTTSGLQKMYSDLAEHFPLLSIEDPFEDSDFKAFSELKAKIDNVKIVGDDLTTTNKERIKKAAQKEAIDAVIIKPNQIGTITETFQAINTARKNDIKIIISHRSGETNDTFIADLAWGTKAYGLKAGAPARGERVAKYNRLLEIVE